MAQQEVQLLQRGRAMISVTEYLWCAELYCHPPRPQAADGGAASRYRG